MWSRPRRDLTKTGLAALGPANSVGARRHEKRDIAVESSEIAGRAFTAHTLRRGHTVKSDV
jgi:hypothetical protein